MIYNLLTLFMTYLLPTKKKSANIAHEFKMGSCLSVTLLK